MQTLSLKRNCSAVQRPGRASRKAVVRPVAFLDGIGKAFAPLIRIFTPNKQIDDAPGDGEWKNTESNFSGSLNNRRDRKPFKDNFANTSAAAKDAAKEEVDADGNPIGYLNKAAQRVVSNNFTSDPTMPKHWDGKEDGAGFSGDIHSRKKDGFHSK